MNPYEMTAGVAALASLIASKLTEEELAMVVVLLAQLKDNLVAITVQRAIIEKEQNKRRAPPNNAEDTYIPPTYRRL